LQKKGIMQKEALEKKLKMFEGVCRDKGIRLTHQRLELYREIALDTSHPSAEDIYVRIRSKLPTISLDTVYRTLSTFESFGVIGRLEILDDRARFDSNPRPHCHMVCVECKNIWDFTWPEFEETELPHQTGGWGHIKSRHIEIRGICEDCLRKRR
jgi:Fur family peroxide stress response transcriptional regulator